MRLILHWFIFFAFYCLSSCSWATSEHRTPLQTDDDTPFSFESLTPRLIHNIFSQMAYLKERERKIECKQQEIVYRLKVIGFSFAPHDLHKYAPILSSQDMLKRINSAQQQMYATLLRQQSIEKEYKELVGPLPMFKKQLQMHSIQALFETIEKIKKKEFLLMNKQLLLEKKMSLKSDVMPHGQPKTISILSSHELFKQIDVQYEQVHLGELRQQELMKQFSLWEKNKQNRKKEKERQEEEQKRQLRLKEEKPKNSLGPQEKGGLFDQGLITTDLPLHLPQKTTKKKLKATPKEKTSNLSSSTPLLSPLSSSKTSEKPSKGAPSHKIYLSPENTLSSHKKNPLYELQPVQSTSNTQHSSYDKPTPSPTSEEPLSLGAPPYS